MLNKQKQAKGRFFFWSQQMMLHVFQDDILLDAFKNAAVSIHTTMALLYPEVLKKYEVW